MSKKSVHTRAAKRNARAKSKRESVARGKQTPSALKQKQANKLFDRIGTRPDFDKVVSEALRQAKSGNVPKSDLKNSADVLAGLKKMTGEVFKMYCYITLVNEMIKKQVIVEDIKFDLPGMTLELMDIDNRIGQMVYLLQNKADMEAKFGDGADFFISTESMEIATIVQNFSDILYEEIARLEPHSLVIEETLSRLAEDVQEENDNARRFKVLQNVAYAYMAEVSLAHKAELEAQENNAGGENQPEAVA